MFAFFLAVFVFAAPFSWKTASAEEAGQEVRIQHYYGQSSYSYFLTDENLIYAFGLGPFGQLGDGTTSSKERYEAKRIDLQNIVQLGVGSKHILALDKDGFVYSWGGNTYGQLGIGRESEIADAMETRENLSRFVSIRDSAYPQRISFPEKVKITKVSASGDLSVALDENKNVWTWGSNSVGQLGNGAEEYGTKSFSAQPSKVKDADGEGNLENIVDICTTNSSVLAVDADGNVYAWGSNFYGALSNQDTDKTSTPVQSFTQNGEPLQVEKLSAYNNNVLALSKDGKVLMYGDNIFGQRGNGTLSVTDKVMQASEVEFFSDKEVKDILSAGNSSFVLLENGDVYGWGLHSKGSLGIGDYSDLPDDVKIVEDGIVVTQNQVVKPYRIVFSEDGQELKMDTFAGTAGVRTFFRDKEGVLWGFGDNTYGQAGNLDETFPNCSTPVRTKLNFSGDFDKEFVMPNYLIKPVITICVFVVLVAAMIVALRIKEKKLEKLDAEIRRQAAEKSQNNTENRTAER